MTLTFMEIVTAIIPTKNEKAKISLIEIIVIEKI
jgi:hypothetical protein